MAATEIKELPLVVIVGPTASGKTALAVEVAEQFGGEIICADSRTIYRSMDIGTAKPSADERARVSHWGLDLISPEQQYSVSEFKKYADEKIAEIRGRGHVPLLVGGTGLYIDAVIFDYQFAGAPDPVLRLKLETMSIDELHEYCEKNNVKLPENKFNKRYVVRAIEKKSHVTTDSTLKENTSIIVGIATDRDLLRDRIAQRTEQLLLHGVVEEATILGEKYGWESQAMTGNIYRLVKSYLLDEISLEELKDKNTTLDWQLAKRQMTWLRRNPHIVWADLPEARQILFQRLASK